MRNPFSRRPRLGTLIVVIVIAAASSALSLATSRALLPLVVASNYLGDMAVAAPVRTQPPSDEIVIVEINEQTLQQFPYRSPVDRRFLAETVQGIAAKGARLIWLDMLFDQPTEPDKDQELRETLRNSRVPLVVTWEPGPLTAAQHDYLDAFVPADERGYAALYEDSLDNVARRVAMQTVLPDGGIVPGVAELILRKLGQPSVELSDVIAWRGMPADGSAPFPSVPAQAIAQLPPGAFLGKIVLLGGIVSLEDRHRSPFAVTYGPAFGNLPGVVIQAHHIDQSINGRHVRSLSTLESFAVGLVPALAAAALALSRFWASIRIVGGVLGTAVTLVAFFLVAATTGVRFDLLQPILAFCIASWLGAAIARRRPG